MGHRGVGLLKPLLALLCAVLALAGCRAPGRRAARPAPAGADRARVQSAVPGRLARGAALYAMYCGGCHGADGQGDGLVAAALNLRPTDLRTPGLVAGVSERELTDRLLQGAPLRTAPRRNAIAEEHQVAALTEYVGTLSVQDWDRIRAGRLVYESSCAACHGGYGMGEGILGGLLLRPPTNLQTAKERYTDPGLRGVIRDGVRAMPPLDGMLEPAEVRAVIAYVRLLSPGYRLYDTYCAGCHGDDGRGVHPEDRLPPATSAPPLHSATLARLTPEQQRAKVLHMFRREQGMMPHFRDTLDESRLGDIVAYLKSRYP